MEKIKAIKGINRYSNIKILKEDEKSLETVQKTAEKIENFFKNNSI